MAKKDITPQELKQLQSREGVALVDVRQPDEYAREHIPQAVNIPQAAVNSGVLEELSAERVVLYCNTGNRSSDAREVVNRVGKVEAYNLAGGIERWRKETGKVKEAQSVALPLQRQVQIAVSLLLLTGIALGFFWRPEFYLVSVLVSLGLLNAGLTGWCGMAKLLSKAPWNK
jgi:rhodanese-related sulfurtransferase